MKRFAVFTAVGLVVALLVLGNLSPSLIGRLARDWKVTLPALVAAWLLVAGILWALLGRPKGPDASSRGGPAQDPGR